MRNSYHFVVATSMQLTFRKVLDNALEYRRRAEEAWVSQLGTDTKIDVERYIANQNKEEVVAMLGKHITERERSSSGVCPISKITLSPQEIQDVTDKQRFVKENLYKLHANSHNLPQTNQTLQTESSNIASSSPQNDTTTELDQTDKATKKLDDDQKEAEMLQQITDEFWTNYNTGWEELLSHTDAQDLFINL